MDSQEIPTTNNQPIEEESQNNKAGFIAFGIILVLLGLITLSARFLIGFVVISIFGWFLLIGGLVQIVQAFLAKKWSSFFVFLTMGILSFVVGGIIILNPILSAVALALLLATFFIVGGLIQIFSSLIHRYPNWGWIFSAGIINFLLGFAIWNNWPLSGLSMFGWFIGVALIVNGFASIFSSVGKSKPEQAAQTRRAKRLV